MRRRALRALCRADRRQHLPLPDVPEGVGQLFRSAHRRAERTISNGPAAHPASSRARSSSSAGSAAIAARRSRSAMSTATGSRVTVGSLDDPSGHRHRGAVRHREPASGVRDAAHAAGLRSDRGRRAAGEAGETHVAPASGPRLTTRLRRASRRGRAAPVKAPRAPLRRRRGRLPPARRRDRRPAPCRGGRRRPCRRAFRRRRAPG